MSHQRFGRTQFQVDRNAVSGGHQADHTALVVAPGSRPVLQPHPKGLGLRARQPGGIPAEPLPFPMLLRFHVRQGEVGEVDLIGREV